MAELVLKIGSLPGCQYEDGDVVDAFNGRRIRCTHAQHYCHAKDAALNGGGLRRNDSLAFMFLEETSQYRLERVSFNEIKRIVIATSEEEILSDTPNEKVEYTNVAEFFRRRLLHPRHRVFGEPGREIYHGGRIDFSNDAMSVVWTEIESRTAIREADHTLFPLGVLDKKDCLAISVDDFDDETLEDLKAPLQDQSSPEEPVVLKKRKHNVVWRNLLGLSLGTQNDVLDPKKSVDIREAVEFVRNDILVVKSVV